MIVIPVDPQTGPNLITGVPADPADPGALFCPIQGAKIIQKFGPTSFALEPPSGGYLHFHSGVDLLAEFGTPIVAAAGGKVTAAGYADYFGLRVAITDSYGLVEIYAHMSDESVRVGDWIQQGQKLGLVGSTGLSVGSHLHLQLEVGACQPIRFRSSAVSNRRCLTSRSRGSARLASAVRNSSPVRTPAHQAGRALVGAFQEVMDRSSWIAG